MALPLSLGNPVPQSLAVTAVQAAPSPAFVYSFPPETCQLLDVPKAEVDGYECPGGKFWLPLQIRILEVPGANAVRVRSDGEPVAETWRYTMQLQKEQGRVVIDPSAPIPAACLPEGAQPGGYVRIVPVIDRGQHGERHITPWDLCTPVPGGVARWSFDRSRYALWLWWLVASGRVPPVHEAYIADQKAGMRAKVARVEMAVQALPAEQREIRVKAATTIRDAAEAAPAAVVIEAPAKRARK